MPITIYGIKNCDTMKKARAWLDKHGVERAKVRFTEVPFPQMNDPLLNGQLDAVVQVEPFRSALMATGRAEILSWTYVETAPGSDITQYIALAPWVEKNRATAVKFARAVIKGAQFANANEAATRDLIGLIAKIQEGEQAGVEFSEDKVPEPEAAIEA